MSCISIFNVRSYFPSLLSLIAFLSHWLWWPRYTRKWPPYTARHHIWQCGDLRVWARPPTRRAAIQSMPGGQAVVKQCAKLLLWDLVFLPIVQFHLKSNILGLRLKLALYLLEEHFAKGNIFEFGPIVKITNYKPWIFLLYGMYLGLSSLKCPVRTYVVWCHGGCLIALDR